MKKPCVIIIYLLLISNSGFSQSENKINNGLLLRGKLLGGFVFEDFWILNGTLGMEYRYNKNFSFGLDFVHINEIFEEEYYPDPINDPDKYMEYAQKNPRTCLLADFRFYPLQKSFAHKRIKPYLSVFSKYGYIVTWNVPNYRFKENDIVRRDGVFYDLGVAGGVHLMFNNERFGLDINIGYCQRNQTEDVQYYSTTGINRMVHDQVVIDDRLAGRLNLYFYLFSNNE